MKETIQKIYAFLSLESYIALAVVCTLIAYVVSGYDRVAEYVLIAVVVCGVLPLVYEIVHSIIHKRFGVDLIALLAIVAALLIGEYAAAGLILLMLSGGEALERYAEGKARSSLKDLVEHMPTTAHRIANGVITECARSDVHTGDVVLVRSQEVVPVDGTILEGSSVVDESMITGEPIPREVTTNARVYAGSVNQGEPLHIRVEKEHDETTYASIIRLVKEAEETKAPLVRLADRYSVIFTAITLALAGIAYFILHSSYLAVAVLVVATPCPLILAAPIAFIAGMSRAAKRGVIVKHGGVFEGVARAQIFMFDKTGTLTFGVPQVSRIVALTRSEEELLTRAASLEQLSTHVIARSIVQYARSRGSTLVYPTGSNEQFGSGIVGDVGGERVFVGKESYLKDHGVIVSDEVHSTIVAIQREGNMVTCIGIGTACVGYIVCEDVVRPEVKQIIAAIHAQGLETLLITGDSTERAEAVRAQTGVSQVLADCLPEDKAGKVQAYEAAHKPVVMVGDGINDAPALAAATVGIAMGVHGETATTQSAQAVIMVDDIARVADLISISKKTMHIARQSIGAGIGLSVIAMVVALLGYLPPVLGAFIQEGIDVAVILNALRVLRA